MLLVVLLHHLDSFLCWRVIVLNDLLSGNNEGIHNSIFDHTESRNSLTHTIDEAKIRLFLGVVNIGLGNLGLNLSLFTWWFVSTILWIAELYLLVQSSLPFCYGLFPLELIKFS